MRAFEIKIDDQTLDYRAPGNLDLEIVKKFFEKKYEVLRIWAEGRHVLGELEKDSRKLFLKLATTAGISEVTKVERDWNEAYRRQVNRDEYNFWVPKNVEGGIFGKNLFFLITDKFEGRLLVDKPKGGQDTGLLLENIDRFIGFSELIQGLKFENLIDRFYGQFDYRQWFLDKTRSWLVGIPVDVRDKYRVEDLFEIVANGLKSLDSRPRHGDFTPWHIFKLTDGKLGLFDAEHAMANGVENYDICYFIQRVFDVLEEDELAIRILNLLIERKYEIEKLKVVLAARAIGGFLDESLDPNPNYQAAKEFKDWVASL